MHKHAWINSLSSRSKMIETLEAQNAMSNLQSPLSRECSGNFSASSSLPLIGEKSGASTRQGTLCNGCRESQTLILFIFVQKRFLADLHRQVQKIFLVIMERQLRVGNPRPHPNKC